MKTTILIIAAFVVLAATAQARPPDFNSPNRIKYLAHDLEEAVHHIHRAAEANAHHYGRREDRALKALHDLDREARHFHQRVERYYRNPHHTDQDYRKLLRTYHNARRAMRGLHAFDHVYDDFRHVEVLMGDLAYYYGGYDRYRAHDDDDGYDGRDAHRRPRRGRVRISLRWRN